MIVKILFAGTHVANVTVPANCSYSPLEYAYNSTQNGHGRWSRGEVIPGPDAEYFFVNPDYNKNIEVLIPGNYRSTREGDEFEYNGSYYVVDSYGFISRNVL